MNTLQELFERTQHLPPTERNNLIAESMQQHAEDDIVRQIEEFSDRGMQNMKQ